MSFDHWFVEGALKRLEHFLLKEWTKTPAAGTEVSLMELKSHLIVCAETTTAIHGLIHRFVFLLN